MIENRRARFSSSVLAAAAALMLSLGGCSGEHVSGPTGPGDGGGSSQPGGAPQYFNGITEAAVQGASIQPSNPRVGQTVTIQATNYLTRVCPFPADGRIFLWPLRQAGGITEGETRDFVYLTVSGGEKRLTRWAPGTAFTITVSSALSSNYALQDRLTEAVAEIPRLTGMSAQVGANGNIVMSVNASEVGSDWARTYLDTANDTIRSARIVFRNVELAASFSDTNQIDTGLNTLLHEVGHALGLGDSANVDDVMFQSWSSSNANPRRFSIREIIAAHMMYRHRDAGNAYPDWDPAVPR